ncbi:hypothetical protein FAI40_09435 [Acetobacteraceae bacterium]|nr:hypothetical protein FAI40_09435 [Acetobacteraceae bacterium]
MSGKFNARTYKGSNRRVLGLFVIGIILLACSSLYFLQPSPPVPEEVRQDISLVIERAALPAPSKASESPAPASAAGSVAIDSTLPTLPVAGSAAQSE